MPIRPIDPAKLQSIRERRLSQPPATTAPAGSPPKRLHHKVDHSGPNRDENGDYIVGKGRPPKAHQWSKGQSGNPRGPKPREKLDPQAQFEKELLSEFTAKVNGEEVQLTLGSFAVQLMKASAAKGAIKAQQSLLELYLGVLRKQVAGDESPEMLEWENELIERMLDEFGLPARPVVRDAARLNGLPETSHD